MPDFDLPEGVLASVESIDLRLVEGTHPFETRNAEAIAGHWQAEHARNPALFDGPMLQFSRLVVSDGRLEGAFHMGRFASFLYWRGLTEKQDMRHAFANPVMVTSDNALVAVEMGAHTANAGLVYFPSGSFDPNDLAQGRLDVAANMRREVAEETGIELSGLPREKGYHLLSLPRGAAIVTRILLPFDADEAEERIRRHAAAEAEPEIARPVILRDAQTGGLRVTAHVPQLLAWHFASPPRREDLVPFV